MIQKLLIANRGEIALRILRTCRALGIQGATIYSEPEVKQPHVTLADKALVVGSTMSATYLDPEAILRVATTWGADAVHPGYGFLSESPRFARMIEGAGIRFVGPRPETMERFGEKHSARILAESLGVPVASGYNGEDQSDERFLAEGARIGYPLMIKAVSGGGGRGMRLVQQADHLIDHLHSARRESLSGFGDDRLLLERYISNARHIEVQLFGDGSGRVIHLFERDCSLQRRNQKIIEEAPAPDLRVERRDALFSAALRLGEAVRLRNATTVEFLVFEQGAHGVPEGFVFLEANCRLQVEHPVTEEITGVDLVALQLGIASGAKLPEQSEIRECGAAIEVRVYAEDPARDFLPTGGTVRCLSFPADTGLRYEHALSPGIEVSPAFDPMVAKIIGSGATRLEARQRLAESLAQTRIEGFKTNLTLLNKILGDPNFRAGGVTTSFLPGFMERARGELSVRAEEVVALYLAVLPHRRIALVPPRFKGRQRAFDPFLMGHYFRLAAPTSGNYQSLPLPVAEYHIQESTVGGEVRCAARFLGIEPLGACRARSSIEVDGRIRNVFWTQFASETGLPQMAEIDGVSRRCAFRFFDGIAPNTPEAEISLDGEQYHLVPLALYSDGPHEGLEESGAIRSPLPGSILRLAVSEGEMVQRGQLVAVLDSMKMEHAISAIQEGRVREIVVRAGESVRVGDVILRIDAEG